MTKLDRKVKSMAENDTFSAKQSQMSKKNANFAAKGCVSKKQG